MKTIAIALSFAALTGCASFSDPAASRDEVKECKQIAHDDAHDNTPWAQVILLGPVIAHHLRQKDSFDRCMAARGFRTTAKG